MNFSDCTGLRVGKTNHGRMVKAPVARLSLTRNCNVSRAAADPTISDLNMYVRNKKNKNELTVLRIK
jgi:hypothetical protein